MNDIKQALESYKPIIKERYKKTITYQYDLLVERFTSSMKGIYNSHSCSLFKEAIRPICDDLRKSDSISEKSNFVINPDKLEKVADSYTTFSIEEMYSKINNKINGVSDVEVLIVQNCEFIIKAKLYENTVLIQQQMIINVSSKGKLFNQYPARIYVNGKQISEKKFKELLK